MASKKAKARHFTRCTVCQIKTNPSDWLDIQEVFNTYIGKKIMGTYCSKKCLLKHFEIKQITFEKKFLFLKFNENKEIWVNRKNPKKHYKVYFQNISPYKWD